MNRSEEDVMRKIKRSLVALGVVAGVSLGGCAPVAFGPAPGLTLSTGPGSSFSNCSALGWQSPQAMRMGGMTAAVQARGFMNRVSAIQSYFSFGFAQSGSNPESWKRVAGGECF
jgi:hypothetical protein